MYTVPTTLMLDQFTRIFKLGFAKYLNIKQTAAAEGLVSLHYDGENVYANTVVGVEDKVPVSIKIEASDKEMPYRLYSNLASIIDASSRALPHMSLEWRESVLMRILPALSKIDYTIMPMLDQELVFEMNNNLDEDQELEVLAFDAAETPRYQNDGFVITDEVLTLLPLEIGSDGRKHGVRTFPMLIVGNNIAFNQHFPVEIFKYPRIEMDDPEYVPTRTGKVRWYTTGFASISTPPSYNDNKETPGKGVGTSGMEYELSISGILPITM